MQTVLHAGCGSEKLPTWLGGRKEVRLDIDPEVKPDIVAGLTDLGDIGPFDMVFCSHTLEHLYPHQVHQALTEFKRVLRDCGGLIVVVPDLEDVKPTEEKVYDSASGPICGLDMYYGYSKYTAINPYMAHHTGFVKETLTKVITQAGFRQVRVERVDVCNLLGVAVK